MARIPDDEIKRLKSEISVERLVTSFGVELKRHGANLVGRCPFHDDHTPSLIVTPETNLWACKGKCNIGGSTIDWVMKTQGVSFRLAVELLRTNHPSLAAGNGHVVRKGTTAKLESPVMPETNDQETLRNVVEFYHKTLKESPEALRYLECRGLTNGEMIGHFQLGFANRKLGLTLPDKNRKAGADLRGHLQKLGILRESGHEHMNGSVVLPIFSLTGDVLGMYGRKITPGLRVGTPMHLYLPGPHRGVWNEEALVASKEIILCESIIDALTFWCAGFRNVTASYGVNGFTEDHRAALKKYETRRVLIAYDRDEAGEKAASTLADELMGMGIECYRIQFPHRMDANEYGLKVQPASKTLGMLLNTAHWLGKGKASERETVEIRPAPVESEPAAEADPAPAEAEQPIETAAKEELPAELEAPEELVFPLAADVAPADPAFSPIQSTAPPGDDMTVEVRPHEMILSRGERRYRVRGFAKNLSYETIKVNLMASRGDAFHVDTLNLYAAHQCTAFIKQAAIEMGLKEDVIRKDLKRLLGKLEQIQHEQITQTLEPKSETAAINAEQHAAAMKLLEDPRLMDRILEDFARCTPGSTLQNLPVPAL